MNTPLRGLAAIIALAHLSACATSPEDIRPKYVSPNVYQAYNCAQLAEEMRRINHEVAALTGEQEDSSGSDTAMMTVGMILFWPALLGLALTDDQEEALAQAKGEQEAVQTQWRMQACDHQPKTITTAAQPTT